MDLLVPYIQETMQFVECQVFLLKKIQISLHQLSTMKCKGKRRFQETKSTRKVSIQFFLLPEHSDRTPKGREELGLLQADLGRRAVLLPENCGHKEIVSVLEEEFHKMKQLSGGWLCYKAAGGCGQRKLTVVPPESGLHSKVFKNSI